MCVQFPRYPSPNCPYLGILGNGPQYTTIAQLGTGTGTGTERGREAERQIIIIISSLYILGVKRNSSAIIN